MSVLYLLQNLYLGLQHLLHVIDLLLSLLTPSLQLLFIVIAQALCCSSVKNHIRTLEFVRTGERRVMAVILCLLMERVFRDSI